MSSLKAIIYLHSLRTWRYKYSFINGAINVGLWIAIFILGALLFVPAEELPMTAPYIFWGIILWNVLSSSVWSVGGWTQFFLSLGMYEEHKLANTSVLKVISGRSITVLMDIVLITPIMYFLVTQITGGKVIFAVSPLYILMGFLGMFLMSLSYSLSLSALSLRMGVPGTLLDISNFFLLVMGGIAVPVESLPGPAKLLAIAIPFSHPAEIVRYGATGNPTYIPLHIELMIMWIYTAALLLLAYFLFRYVEDKYLRLYGPRAVGRM